MLFKAPILLLLLSVFAGKVQAASVSVQQLQQLMHENQGRVIYLDFWASWCIPCKTSFPWMNSMQKKYAEQGLTIITVNLDAERSFADTFLQDNPAEFSVIFDPQSTIARKFDLKGMPSSYLYNKKGKAVKAHVGFFVEKQVQYEAEIVELLQQ